MYSVLLSLLPLTGLVAALPQAINLHERLARSIEQEEGHGIYRRCGENLQGWAPTPDNWNAAGTTQFLQQYQSNNSNSGKPLWKALGDQFMPYDVSFDCQVGDTGLCSDTDCEQVLQHDNSTKNPVFAIDSLIGLTQQSTKLWNSMQTATNVAGLLNQQNFVDLFTDSARFSPQQNLVLHEIVNFFNYAIFAGLAFLGPVGALSAVAKASLSSFGTLTAGGIEAFGTAASAPSQSEIELQQMSTVGKYLANIAGPVRNNFANTINNVLSGGKDPAGSDFAAYSAGGFFADWRSNYANYTQPVSDNFMTNIVVGGAINALWRASAVYIVATTAQNNDCNNDNRVSGVQKFCRNGDNWIYGIYAISTTADDTSHPAVMPWGLDKLNQIGANVTISSSDVIDSSIKAYHAAKFNYEMVRASRWTQAFISWGDNSPASLGADFEGTFTIPVCYDPTGAAMSNGNHPCYCGQNGEETGPFQTAAGLDQNTDQYQYVGCKITPGSSGSACNPLVGCGNPNPLSTQ